MQIIYTKTPVDLSGPNIAESIIFGFAFSIWHQQLRLGKPNVNAVFSGWNSGTVSEFMKQVQKGLETDPETVPLD